MTEAAHTNAQGTAEPVAEHRLTRLQAQRMRRATRADITYCVLILLLAALALWSGRATARHLSPQAAVQVSRQMDDLELPIVLPNANLVRDDGAATQLWDVAQAPRSIVSFYAPWCAPCQEELPLLVTGMRDHPDRLVVVVASDEDRVEVREKLDNLGLKDLRFHVDGDNQLAAGARVASLPTTFLIGRKGRVLERIVGYSGYRLHMLIYKAASVDSAKSNDN